MVETKRFPLRAVLSVTTRRLVSKDIGELYRILGWMANDEPMTHQLPRFMEEAKPWLLRWFPELKDEEVHLELALTGVPSDGVAEAIAAYLQAARIRGCKAEYDIPRLPADDHERKDALSELVEMRGTSEGIIVMQAEDPQE